MARFALPRIALCVVGLVLMFVAPVKGITYQASSYIRHFRVSDEMVFRWNIVDLSTPAAARIDFALEVLSNTGWIGIGVAQPAAAMPGADIGVAFINSSSKQLSIGDYYATDYAKPILDPCGENHWRAVGYHRNASATIIMGSRVLSVKNATFDRSIISPSTADPTPSTMLIFAFGTSQTFSMHAKAAHRVINLFSSVPNRTEVFKGLKEARVVMRRHPITTAETEYATSECYSAAELSFTGSWGARKAYARGFLLHKESKHVHHVVLRGHSTATCSGGRLSDIYEAASDVEGSAVVFPDNVALDLSVFKSFSVQTHYDNPLGELAGLDGSGAIIYWTYDAPKTTAGLLSLGDPAVFLAGSYLPDGKSTFTFECPSSCTKFLPHDITILFRSHHMHAHGKRMSTEVIAANGTTLQSIVTEYYDFHRQRPVQLAQPVTVRKGDILRTSCSYDTNGLVRWGLGSGDEMCIDFLYYYPANAAIDVNACGLVVGCGIVASVEEGSKAALKRQFGTGFCATTARPTTGRPTTARPTTSRPTTARPTTGRPTTARPTTRSR